MNKQLLAECQAKLLAEQKKIKTVLGHETVTDSEAHDGRRPIFAEDGREDGENASESEQFGNDFSVTEDLGDRLDLVEGALKRIENGTYGKCVVGGEDIEAARLQAEPAALTCIAHSK